MSILQAGGPDQGQTAQRNPQAEWALVGVKYASDKARGRHDAPTCRNAALRWSKFGFIFAEV